MNKLHNDDDQGKHHKVQENYKAVGYKNNRPTAEQEPLHFVLKRRRK